jgi:ferredoxin
MGVLDDYDDALDKVYSGTAAPSIDPSVPSHAQLDLDEDGEPVLARFTYVDENTCIGCKNCALVARNTILMEEEFGKARVFAQGGDFDELIAEAIDSCPVNCIHYVSREDLVTLETERAQKKVTINNYGNFKRAFTGGTFAREETKAKYYDNAQLGTRPRSLTRGLRVRF